MTKKIILGYRKFKSKKGEEYCVAQVMAPYSDREIKTGAVGNKCEDIFIPKAYHDFFDPSCVNKTMAIDYFVDNGRAFIDTIDIL